MEYLSDTLQIRILKRNLDLQIMEDLMQSSKRHQAPLQLVHAWYLSFPQTMIHLIQFRNGSVDLHRGTPISQDLKLRIFLSFHGSFPYDALRAKLVIWFQAPVTCIASLMLGGISGFT